MFMPSKTQKKEHSPYSKWLSKRKSSNTGSANIIKEEAKVKPVKKNPAKKKSSKTKKKAG